MQLFLLSWPSATELENTSKQERILTVRPQKPKHIRFGWSHTDTSEPVVRYEDPIEHLKFDYL
jgi:hypothetical protein